jgi:phospholipase/carboxylesterase
MSELLPAIEMTHSPKGLPANFAIIWLHGLGADGHDFEAIVPELKLPNDLAIRFIFPHAPVRPVTINGGMEMRSWYDILSIDEMRTINEKQLQKSCEQLEALIENEIARGIPSERIIVAGFSQGGAVVLTTVLRYNKQLAGILALSTYLPAPGWLESDRSSQNATIPVFMAHGRQDPVVPYGLAVSARQKLTSWGYSVKWFEYPMPHSVCYEEIQDISNWLQKIFAAYK